MVIKYNNKEYSSIANFAKDLGLRYSTVAAQLRKGLSLDEIIQRQKIHENETHSTKQACEWEGQSFKSLYEAGTTLGISPSQLYFLKNTRKLSPSGAIEEAMRAKNPNKPGKRTECYVEGKKYESREAAVSAYDIPYITVMTRMYRDNITFEEAILRGNKDRKRLKAMPTVFDKTKILIVEDIDDKQLPKDYLNLIEKLLNYKYHPEFYEIPDEAFIIKISETFYNKKFACDCWIVLGKLHAEIIVTGFIPKKIAQNRLSMFETVNFLNAKYSGTKIWCPDLKNNPQDIYIGHSMSYTKKKEIDIQTLIANLFTLFGTCESMTRDF